MTASDLATEFALQLFDEVGAENYAEIRRRNSVETIPGVCHSHDFCDANMVMWNAYVKVYGCEPDMDAPNDQALWMDRFNAAWDLWRINSK